LEIERAIVEIRCASEGLQDSCMKTLFSILLCAPLCSCALPGLRVAPRYGLYEVSGEGAVGAGPGSASFDLEQAGVDSVEAVGVRADLKFGLTHIIATADLPEFDGTGTLGAAIDDGMGNTIPANTPVRTQLDFALANGLVVFDLVPGDTFEVALGVGAAYISVDQRYLDVGSMVEVRVDEDFILPVLAGVFAFHLFSYEVGAMVSGISADYDGDSVFFFSGDIYGRMKLFGGTHRVRGSLTAGFWLNQTEIEYADGPGFVETEITLMAPYIGVEFSL
jgi:hypothetical protein